MLNRVQRRLPPLQSSTIFPSAQPLSGLFRYDSLWYGTVRYDTLLYGTVRYSTVPYTPLPTQDQAGPLFLW